MTQVAPPAVVQINQSGNSNKQSELPSNHSQVRNKHSELPDINNHSEVVSWVSLATHTHASCRFVR
jgi:hypothetical protein